MLERLQLYGRLQNYRFPITILIQRLSSVCRIIIGVFSFVADQVQGKRRLHKPLQSISMMILVRW